MNLRSVKKLALCLCLLTTTFAKIVNAECDYKLQNEINAAAANVKAQYELEQVVVDENGKERPDLPLEEGMVPEGEKTVRNKIKIKIYNITERVYINLFGDKEDVNETYHSNDLIDNTLTYEVPDMNIIREYTIKVYSENEECGGELRTIQIKTPKYNQYALYNSCENSDKYYCKEFVTEEIPENIFHDVYEESSKEESTEKKEKLSAEGKIKIGSIVLTIGVIAVLLATRRTKGNII